jgi:hypothetical protein
LGDHLVRRNTGTIQNSERQLDLADVRASGAGNDIRPILHGRCLQQLIAAKEIRT